MTCAPNNIRRLTITNLHSRVKNASIKLMDYGLWNRESMLWCQGTPSSGSTRGIGWNGAVPSSLWGNGLSASNREQTQLLLDACVESFA